MRTAAADFNLSLDDKKRTLIEQAFREGKRLDLIARIAYPSLYNDETKTAEYRKGTTRIIYPADWELRRMIKEKLLAELGFDDFGEFTSKRAKIVAQQKHVPGERKAKKQALARDSHKCQVTAATDDIDVHHIDMDRTNNELWNLITLHRRVHRSIHRYARGLVTVDPGERGWNELEDCVRYVGCLRQKRYPEAEVIVEMLMPSGAFYPELDREPELLSIRRIEQLDPLIEEGSSLTEKYIADMVYIEKKAQEGPCCFRCALHGGLGAYPSERCKRSEAIDFVCEDYTKDPDYIPNYYRGKLPMYAPRIRFSLLDVLPGPYCGPRQSTL